MLHPAKVVNAWLTAVMRTHICHSNLQVDTHAVMMDSNGRLSIPLPDVPVSTGWMDGWMDGWMHQFNWHAGWHKALALLGVVADCLKALDDWYSMLIGY
jgi:hypothetical protein